VEMGPFRFVVKDLPRMVDMGLYLPVDIGTAVDYSVEEVSCCVVDLVQWMLH
jgi:hypothetical protein